MMRLTLQKSCTTCVLWVLLLGSGSRAHAQDLTKLATDLAAKIHAKKYERVTVVDFLDLDQKSNKLTKLMTLQLQSALTEPERDLVVVDQGHIAELFDQMDKLSQGLIDPATARQLGKITGTDVLIYGTVMVSSLSVRLDVSAIDLQTAKVIASGSASPKRFGMLDKLAREADHEETALAEDEEVQVPVKKASGKNVLARSRRDQGFLFDFHECSLVSDALTCTLSITSEGRDRWIAVSATSRAWNETGEEFPSNDLAISNSQGDHCVAKALLKDVATNLTLTFPNFATEDSIVERLRVAWVEGNACYYQFRPVDFEKIALSDGPSPSTRQRSGNGTASASNATGSKKGGGLFGRLTEKIIDAAASTAEKVIDKNAKKLSGEDKDPPQQ